MRCRQQRYSLEQRYSLASAMLLFGKQQHVGVRALFGLYSSPIAQSGHGPTATRALNRTARQRVQ